METILKINSEKTHTDCDILPWVPGNQLWDVPITECCLLLELFQLTDFFLFFSTSTQLCTKTFEFDSPQFLSAFKLVDVCMHIQRLDMKKKDNKSHY